MASTLFTPLTTNEEVNLSGGAPKIKPNKIKNIRGGNGGNGQGGNADASANGGVFIIIVGNGSINNSDINGGTVIGGNANGGNGNGGNGGNAKG
ncbi:MAG: hypothetical protein ICV54_17415 [Nostoc sp. C3-bin3]|nr:hypothetical protein [Nostoc sp. C3-bin3]